MVSLLVDDFVFFVSLFILPFVNIEYESIKDSSHAVAKCHGIYKQWKKKQAKKSDAMEEDKYEEGKIYKFQFSSFSGDGNTTDFNAND